MTALSLKSDIGMVGRPRYRDRVEAVFDFKPGCLDHALSAIQHIGPDNIFLPRCYFLASMNAVLGMHAMGKAQDCPLWRMNRDN